jgi:hypothetical protein
VRRAAILLLPLLLLVPHGVRSEDGHAPGSTTPAVALGEAHGEAFDDGLPRVRLVRTESPPAIDGVLDDAAWRSAATVTRLTQVEPREGAEPSEPTEMLLLFDSDFLYLGFRCHDREPDKIVATAMVRDVDLFSDDRVSVSIDTFFDRRNGYLFQVNPLGTRTDALIENSSRVIRDWNGIWYAKARIDEAGWTAEVAIPFKTLNFDPSETRWGFNLLRVIRRRDERLQWASPFRNKPMVDMGIAGILEGLEGLEQGIGIEVKPSLSVTQHRVYGRDDLQLDPSLDAFYKITPSLTAALTLNTNFDDAEVDERRINFTRFGLFFPEQRDFFLQDTSIFEFGGLNKGLGRTGERIDRNGLPFHSRRIGVDEEGEALDLLGGTKLTGRIGRLNLGLLNVQQDAYDRVDATNLSVARVTMNVLEESNLGLIGTFGDPNSNDDNALMGFDFNYRTNALPDGQRLTGNAWFQQSFSTGTAHDESAWGARVAYPNDRIHFDLSFREVQENFRPALGFVNRTGIRKLDGSFSYRFRPAGVIRTVDVGAFGSVVTDTSNEVQSGNVYLDLLDVRNDYGDRFLVRYIYRHEELTERFEIDEKVTIAPGTYSFHRSLLWLDTSPSRPLRAKLLVGFGEFFSGHRLAFYPTLEWRPSSHLFVSLEWKQNDFRLREGKFTKRLLRARVNLQFTPDLSWNTLAQYHNKEDVLEIDSRLRWIVQPGNEIFIGINQRYDVEADAVDPARTRSTFKTGWTFRF